jgi:hypothetical protein
MLVVTDLEHERDHHPPAPVDEPLVGIDQRWQA